MTDSEFWTTTTDADELRERWTKAAQPPPEDIRGSLWLVLLGQGRIVAGGNSAVVPAGDVSFDARASALKACSRVAAKLPGGEAPGPYTKDASLLLTQFCQAKSLNFDDHAYLATLILPLFALKMSRNERYACFYSIWERFGYLPTYGGEDDVLSRFIMGLLLYHDPQLALHLKSVGASDKIANLTNVMGLFVLHAPLETSVTLFENLLRHNDPELSIFVLIHSLQQHRSAILGLTDSVGVESFLSAMPVPSNDETISDTFVAAKLLQLKTPMSAVTLVHRKLFVSVANATGVAQDDTAPLSKRSKEIEEAALQVDVADIDDDSAQAPWKIVDLRTSDQIKATCAIKDAIVLDTSVLLTDPESFAQSVGPLLGSSSGRCLVVYWQEAEAPPSSSNSKAIHSAWPVFSAIADTLAIVFYLQSKGVRHVAVLHDGFQAIHSFNSGHYLVNHTPSKCQICRGNAPVPAPESSSAGSQPSSNISSSLFKPLSLFGSSSTDPQAAPTAAATVATSLSSGFSWLSKSVGSAASTAATSAVATANTFTKSTPASPTQGSTQAPPAADAATEVNDTSLASWVTSRVKQTSTVIGTRINQIATNIMDELDAAAAAAPDQPFKIPAGSTEEPLDKSTLVSTATWLMDPTTHMFPGHVVTNPPNRRFLPRTLVVTEDELVIVREHAQRPDTVYVLSTHSLLDIKRLAVRKSNRRVITIGFKSATTDAAEKKEESQPLSVHTFILPSDAYEFTDLLKTRVREMTSSATADADVLPFAPSASNASHADAAAAANAPLAATEAAVDTARE